jgi:mannosyltransferase
MNVVHARAIQAGHKSGEQVDGAEVNGGLSRSELLILIALCAASVVACFFDLGARSLWNDEVFSGLIALHHGTDLWHAVTIDGGNMVIYRLLLRLCVALFGGGQFALRIVSALAGVALTPVMFFLCRRMFGTRTGVVATAIVAVSPPLVVWAQQAQGYCLGTLLVASSALALLRAVECPTRRRCFVYGLLAVLSIYTIVWAGLFLVAQWLPLLFGRGTRVRLGEMLTVAGGVGVAYVPLVVLAVRNGSGNVLLMNAPPSRTEGIHIVQELSSAVAPEFFRTTLVVATVTVIAVLCWITASAELLSRIRRAPGDFETMCLGIALSWLLLPLAVDAIFSIAYRSLFVPAYLVQSALAGALVVAFVFVKVLPGLLSYALAIGFVGLLVAALVPTYGVSFEQFAQAARYIRSASRPGDCLTVNKPELASNLAYYFSLQGGMSALPQLVEPTRTWSDTLDPTLRVPPPSESWAIVVSSCSRLWMVVSREGTGELLIDSEANWFDHNGYKQVTLSKFVGINVRLFARRLWLAFPVPSCVGVCGKT